MADFDSTMTKMSHNGQPADSSFKALIKSDFLPVHVKRATQELYNKYYSIEKDY
jgi:hypothetical protein